MSVVVSAPREGVRLLTLDRSADLNTLNRDLVLELHAALDAVDADLSCRVLVLTGAGRAFCASRIRSSRFCARCRVRTVKPLRSTNNRNLC